MVVSEFLYHTNCPSCHSRDNLGIYTDHAYCFGCGYYEGYNEVNKNALIKKDNNKNNGSIDNLGFPSDFDYHIPIEGLNWLNQYGITAGEIHANRIGWSRDGKLIRQEILFSPCMVFPIYDNKGILQMWQGRYFGHDTSVPKYYTRGAKDCIHVLGHEGPLVLCEDLISAIKIARVSRASPLWGSSVNTDQLTWYRALTDDLVLWLDHDKTIEARRFAKRASQWFPKVRVVSTPLDPKCYDSEAITAFLKA
jgi:Zn ribbon nucleic-acid-binding protein